MTGLAQRLADRYTVVTYDRRGNSRSLLDEPPGPQRVEIHADDAHRLLTAVAGDAPAYVFGNSSGGQIGLELVARHPSRSVSWSPMSRRSLSFSPTGRAGGT